MIRPLLWLPAAIALTSLPASAQDAALEKQARKLHEVAGGTYCERPEGAYVPDEDYEAWTFDYQPSWSEDEQDKEEITLIRIFCSAGAYNISDAYYWKREYEGLQPLSFAQPVFDVEYENQDTLDGKVLGITVTGMGATTLLVNSDFDPETLTVSSHSLWRGLGDASSSGTWVFQDGEFALVRYDVDASYDDEENPETVVDYASGDRASSQN